MKCLENKDVFAISKLEQKITFKDCLNSSPLVNQKANEKNICKAIYVIIERFNDLVNVGKPLNQNQMIQLSLDLFERFGGESLEDIALFFKMARNGDFGAIQRLDSVTIMLWVPKYFDLKIEAREQEIQNEKNVRQRQEDEGVANHVPDKKAKKNLEKLSKMLKGSKKTTGILNKENPLFNYDAYLKNLQKTVNEMDNELLKTMFANTSKFSHLQVWEILNNEIELRKLTKKNTGNNEN